MDRPHSAKMVFEPQPRNCSCCMTNYEETESETDESIEDDKKCKDTKRSKNKSVDKKKRAKEQYKQNKKKRKLMKEEKVALMREIKRREDFVTACCEGLLLTPCGSAGSFSDEIEEKEQANFYLQCKCSRDGCNSKNKTGCCKKTERQTKWHGDFPCQCGDCKYITNEFDPRNGCCKKANEQSTICYCKHNNEQQSCLNENSPISPCLDRHDKQHCSGIVNEKRLINKGKQRKDRGSCSSIKRAAACQNFDYRSEPLRMSDETDLVLLETVRRVVQMQDEERCEEDPEYREAVRQMNYLLNERVRKKYFLDQTPLRSPITSTRIHEDGVSNIENYFPDMSEIPSTQTALVEAYEKVVDLRKQGRLPEDFEMTEAIQNMRQIMRAFSQRQPCNQSYSTTEQPCNQTSQWAPSQPPPAAAHSTMNSNRPLNQTQYSSFKNRLQSQFPDGSRPIPYSTPMGSVLNTSRPCERGQNSVIQNMPSGDTIGHICIPKQILWDATEPGSSQVCITLTFQQTCASPSGRGQFRSMQTENQLPTMMSVETNSGLPTFLSNEPSLTSSPIPRQLQETKTYSPKCSAKIKTKPKCPLPQPPFETNREPDFGRIPHQCQVDTCPAYTCDEPGLGKKPKKENARQFLKASNNYKKQILEDIPTRPLCNVDKQKKSPSPIDNFTDHSNCKSGCSLLTANQNAKIDSMPSNLENWQEPMIPRGAIATKEELCMMMDRIKCLQKELKKYSEV